MKKIYIVTGANGFLGNNILRALKDGDEVRALVLPEEPVAALRGLRCNIYRGDVTRPETLEKLFQKEPDDELCVIHCAAIVYIKTKYNRRVYEVNVNGTKNIARKTLAAGGKLVYVSSVHAIPEQPNGGVITEITDFRPEKVEGEYAKTKAEAARFLMKMVREQGLDCCVLHPSGIIGPYDFGNSHLTQMILDCVNGRLTACVEGGYDFVDVRDVADGVIRACTRGKAGECYILSNRFVSIRELLGYVSRAAHTKPVKTVLPMWLAKVTAPLSEVYYKILRQPPLYTRYSLFTLTANANFSHEKAHRELGYQNRPIRDTVEDTVQWLARQGRIRKK